MTRPIVDGQRQPRPPEHPLRLLELPEREPIPGLQTIEWLLQDNPDAWAITVPMDLSELGKGAAA